MRADDLTVTRFADLFRRLCLAKNKHITASDASATVTVWFDAVRRYPEPIVSQAIERLVVTETRFFPEAGKLVAVCRELETDEARRLRIRHGDTPAGNQCGLCGREFYVAGYENGSGKVVERLRCDCRPCGEGWFTPLALAHVPKPVVDWDALRMTLPSPPSSSSDLTAKKAAFRDALELTI